MFFFWGQPFRHLFLQIKLTKNNAVRYTGLAKHRLAGRRRRRAYSGFRVRCKRQTAIVGAIARGTTMILQTTLCLTAAAVVINLWLAMRIGRLRYALKVSVGDGGQDPIIRRMRAQANFIENAPLTLLLFGLVEASGVRGALGGGIWLAPLGAVFLIGRVAHAYGMEDDPRFKAGRGIGMMTTILTQLVLVIVSVLIALGRL